MTDGTNGEFGASGGGGVSSCHRVTKSRGHRARGLGVRGGMAGARAIGMGALMAGVMGVVCAGHAAAQDLGIKAPPQTRTIAIVNATIHPVSGPSIERGHVFFDKGKITSVGPGDGVMPLGALVIDAKDKHVYPGLFGSVSQVGLSEIESVRATLDYRETGDMTPEVYAAVAVNPDSTLLPVTRANGILLEGIFPTGGVIPGRVSVIQLEGWTWEDMTVKRDAGMVIGFPQVRQGQNLFGRADDSGQRRLNESYDALDEMFNRAEAYRGMRGANPGHPVDARLEGMQGVLPDAEGKPRAEQLPVYLMVNEADQIAAGVRWAIGRGLKPVVVGGRDAPLVLDLLKHHEVPVIVVGTHRFPKRTDSGYNETYLLPGVLEAAGLTWCLASGDEPAHERGLPYHAAQAVAHGLAHEAAVRSVTLNTARVLGVADRVGSIEVGKDATLIITDGDPLEVRTKTEMAFIQGKTIDLGSKHSALYKKYLEKYRQLGLIEGR